MIVITIAFVSCLVWVCLRLPDANAPLLWLRSGMERYADRKAITMLPILRFGVCRSSDWSIHVQRISSHKRIASAFSRSHDSHSNDRFSSHTDFSAWKQYFRNTATFGILPCLPAISDSSGAANIRQIPSVSGILTRFPCSANKNACPIARVAHLPQKPCYSVYYMRACFTHTKRPLLPCDLAGKRSLVFSVYSVWLYAKTTFLFK